ncbi:LLM class F420-dependent oxidoreductase [Mycolicibacterium sp.]|uniref:LLM class F420-dependent oxidoreductase n=1 Tax=Mycolicibacterium sp. TaxID=2320850 RepID=UPI003D12914F
MEVAGVGVWSSQLRYGDPAEAREAAAELEELGFTALWVPDAGGPLFDSVRGLLTATRRTVIATGILNLWMHDPNRVAAEYTELTARHGARFLMGIGVSHAPLLDSGDLHRYRRPLGAMRSFLDALDQAVSPVPVEERILAALGPNMLELAAARSRGVHTCFVTPEHTHHAREVLGPRPLLAPEQTVLLTDSRAAARDVGDDWLRATVALPNYANNLRRTGFTDEDLAGLSDRLFDSVIAWGDEDAVAHRVAEHFSTGADHVCVQVLTADPTEFPREQWRRLAAALT